MSSTKWPDLQIQEVFFDAHFVDMTALLMQSPLISRVSWLIDRDICMLTAHSSSFAVENPSQRATNNVESLIVSMLWH